MKQYKLAINGNPYTVKILELAKDVVTAEVNGIRHTVAIDEIENLALFGTGQQPPQSQPVPAAPSRKAGEQKATAARTAPSLFGSDNVIAPIPGQIIAINVARGQEICKGEPVLVLEAMKMENIITAKRDGVIAEICVSAGEAVTQDQVLITMA
ncbi:biotin/lipoyl-containing protein [Desulfosediminicola sp.]|uniref:biotin/lipoyl-containing protein n=1 Tax=Desulfosediminicola sp. TaxID=2886825 RepID=UPI003AF285A9